MSAHGLEKEAQSRIQQIAAPFNLRNSLLSDAEGFCDLLLGESACLPELPERHFFGNELSGTGLDFLALSWSKSADNVVHVSGHGLFPFLLLQSTQMRVKAF